jgi:hypothetical protein
MDKLALLLLRLNRCNQPILGDRYPQYRYYPTVIHAIASDIIIEVRKRITSIFSAVAVDC